MSLGQLAFGLAQPKNREAVKNDDKFNIAWIFLGLISSTHLNSYKHHCN